MDPEQSTPDTAPGNAADLASHPGASHPQTSRAQTSRARAPRRRVARRAFLTGGLSLVLVAGGVTWWAADRFLIPHVEVTDVAAYEAEHAAVVTTTTPEPEATTLTDTSYSNGSTSVTLSTVTTDALTSYVADVVLGDATDLRSAFANNQFGENITQTTSEIAADNAAVFAINGAAGVPDRHDQDAADQGRSRVRGILREQGRAPGSSVTPRAVHLTA
ncbi:hypothetical protein [Microbacterium sp. NPDC086615]|jgi:hypothetical protein|uniref:hypothetical protein n=1 Tax=Microbacterium sp. NPDC086615 TaxID=3154865 RepID=UPI0034299448|nr:exopolysaccharide biosynthesis protein [Microbacterium sp.]